MGYWWVNQKKTFRHECEGGFLWAPMEANGGGDRFYWSNMERIRAGDIIFSYSHGVIKAVSVAIGGAYASPKPDFGGVKDWNDEGRRVDAQYVELKAPLPLKSFQNEIELDLPQKYSPLKATGANQGYLYELPEAAARKILSMLDEQLPATKVDLERVPMVTKEVPERGADAVGLTTRRIGHERFRTSLHDYWDGRCAVTGVANAGLLRASHIVAWSESSPEEKVDIYNGLLLAVNLDAAFDRHLISFDEEGKIIFADCFIREDAGALGIHPGMHLRNFSEEHIKYIRRHRAVLEAKWGRSL